MYHRSLLYKLFSYVMVATMLLPNVALAAGVAPPDAIPATTGRSAAEADPFDLLASKTAASANQPAGGAPVIQESDLAAGGSLAAQTQVSAPIGRLLFAPAIDLDGNPASNPANAGRVPVVDLLGQLGGIIKLAAQLESETPGVEPLRVPVTFRVWNNAGFEYEETVESDVWGAVTIQLPLKDIAADYSYQASAAGYGVTETRHFRFNPSEVSIRFHADGATLTYAPGPDGWLVFTVTTNAPLVAERDEILLTLYRQPLRDTLSDIQAQLGDIETLSAEDLAAAALMPMPEVVMRVVDPYTARAEVQLPAGEYGAVASVEINGDLLEYFTSDAVTATVEMAAAAPDWGDTREAAWLSDIEYEPGKTLALYEGEPGRAVFGLLDSAHLPAVKQDLAGETQIINVWRTGPFEYKEETYNVKVETHVDDGKKIVTLSNFNYDPVVQHYEFAIQSLHEEDITDTLTIDVMGPGGIVILHKEAPVVLRAGQTLFYTVEVPAELGKPQGIRLHLADPLIEDFQAIADAFQRVYEIFSVKGFARLFLRVFAEVFRQRLIEIKFTQGQPVEIKTDFLDELMRDPWTALIRLAEGALGSVSLFRISWRDIYDLVVNGNMEALDKILGVLSIDIGGLGVEGGAEVGVTLSADTGDCPDDADRQALEQKLKDIAYRLNAQLAGDAINTTFPFRGTRVPIYPPLALTGLVLRLRIGGEIDAQGLSVTLSGFASLGAESRLGIALDFGLISIIRDLIARVRGGGGALDDPRLNTVGWFAVAKILHKVVTGVMKWVDIYKIIDDIINVQIPNGNCDPEPPDPRPPDDRQDVWQGVESYYQGETYEATRDNLNQLIQKAQDQSLDRAATFLTLQLRQEEMAALLDDTPGYTDYLSRTAEIMVEADWDVLNILTGTIPISPTQTLTDAITIRLEQAYDDLNNLTYVVNQRQLEDGLALAERDYQTLLGQELELQHELRELFTLNVIGVATTGFANSTLSALAAMGLPSQLVSLWPSDGEYLGLPAPYLSPELAPRAMVVPSGGLHAIANSPSARDWLDAYVSSGGLLIVFTQAFGSDWSALPGGQVAGVGYEEDQRWQHGTVEAGQPSDWLVWMGIPKPDIQIDGAFTAWPADANILLKRTFGSYAGSPVMLEYAHGAGTVLATTAYGDWAWGTNFWWGDDARLTHSILIRAYLLSKGQDVSDVFTGDPASTVAVNFPLVNTAVGDATSARLEIPLVWGSGSGSSVATVPLSLAPGQTTDISASIPTPPVRRNVHDWTQVGLYRVKVTVTTSRGNYTVWGPFVYVRSPILPPALSGSLQVAQTPVSLYGTGIVSATVRNFTNMTRTAIISDLNGVPTTPVSVTVPPRGAASQVFTLFMDSSKAVSAGFYDASNGKLIGRSSTVVGIAFPNLNASPTVPPAFYDGVEIPFLVTNTASQGAALAASLSVSMTAPSGALVWTATQALPPIPAGEKVSQAFIFAGLIDELGTYQLSYRVDDGRGLTRQSYVPVPSRLTLSAVLDRDAYRIRETGELVVTIRNTGQFELAPTLNVSSTALVLTDSQMLNLSVGSGQTITYPFTVPDTLLDGAHDVTVSYQLGAETYILPLKLIIPTSKVGLTLDAISYAAGDTIVVPLTNDGGVDAPVNAKLDLIDSQGSLLATTVQTPTIPAGGSGQLDLTIPDNVTGGAYRLLVTGQDLHTADPLFLYRNLTVSGLTAGLSVETDRSNYFSDEMVEALASINLLTGEMPDGSLELRICSAVSPDVISSHAGDPPPDFDYEDGYEATETAFAWEDITQYGLIVAEGDDTYTQVELGFPFQFYGVTYTNMYVGSNGYITFDQGYTESFNEPIPTPNWPNNAIYALWDNLIPTGGENGQVYAKRVDDQRYIVQWQAVLHSDDDCCPESLALPEATAILTGTQQLTSTFQVILDGSDNSITLQYLDMGRPYSATVGVENSLGNVATPISFDETGIITDGVAFELMTATQLVTVTTYVEEPAVFDWIEIAGGGLVTGTIVAEGDDTYTVLDLPFTFEFYGVPYDQMKVDSNGYISFNPYDGSVYSNSPIPSIYEPNNAAYTLWTDLYPVGGPYGNVYAAQLDATRYVVQWNNVAHCCDLGAAETFQLILDSADNSITFQYLDVTEADYATVGVEDASGTEATQLAYSDPGVIYDGYAVRLTRQEIQVPQVGYVATSTALAWEDISADSAIRAVASGYITNELVDLGFTFTFYGLTYTQAFVHSNGYVSFGQGYYDYGANSDIPNLPEPNNAIYGLWDTLYPVGGDYGQIYAGQVAPDRYVVQYQNVAHCCYVGDPETFQVILDGTDNTITLNYLDVSYVGSATVGVENLAGSRATKVSYNQSDVITDGYATLLTPVLVPVPTGDSIVTPSYIAHTIPAGGSAVEPRLDVVLGAQAVERADVLILFDLSGSMGSVLNTAKTNAVSIMNSIRTFVPDSAFAAASFVDYPYCYNYAGYNACYGVGGDYAYQLNRDVTTDISAVNSAINAMTLHNGYDYPEDYTRALYETQFATWRDGAKRIVIIFGDAPGHDTNFGGRNYGVDPGRDNIAGTADDLDFETTVQQLADAGITVMPVHSAFGVEGIISFEYMASQTGGTAYVLGSVGNLPELVAAAVAEATSHVNRMSLRLASPYETWLAYTPPEILDVDAGELATFQPLTFTVPPGTPPGLYEFDLIVDGDGAAVALVPTTILVTEEDACGYVLWETTVPVSTTTTFDFSEVTGPFNVTGRLILDGKLYASSGQLAAADQYPFYLYDRTTALTLESERDVYRPGQTINVSGVVTNTAALTATFVFNLNAGATTLISQTLTLLPGEGYPYSASLLATETMTLTATAQAATASLVLVVADPAIEATLLAPDVAGRSPFSATLVVTNTGIVTAAVDLTLASVAGPSVVLEPGQVALMNADLTIDADTTIAAEVGGDVPLSLSKLVLEGEYAGLDLMAPASDVAGLVEVPYTISGTGMLATGGVLNVQLDGVAVASLPFTVLAGESLSGSLALDIPAGAHSVTGQLVHPTGAQLAEDSQAVTLLALAEPAEPAVTLNNISLSPTPVAAGSALEVTLDLTNAGASGPIIVGVQLFGPEEQYVIEPASFSDSSFSFSVSIPGDMPADDYFGQVTINGEAFPFTAQVVGLDVVMGLSLDKLAYLAGEQAQLTVTLTDRAGVTADYLVMPRYLTAEDYYTVTVPANGTAQYVFTFTATEPARANVFLANVGAPPAFDRTVLTLDSLPVNVNDPAQGVSLVFDQAVYDAGDTVNMTIDVVEGVAETVFIMGPMELRFQEDGFVFWGAPVDDGFGFVVTTTQTLSYTLPAAMREGRYTFVVLIDGESYEYPIDVHGYKVTTRHMTLDQSRYADGDTIKAIVEFWNQKDEPITDMRLTAWVFTPDESQVLDLLPAVSQTVDLLPGLNVFEVSGILDTPAVGPHRLLVNIGPAGTGWRIAGASTQFDVGWAHLVELITDQGNYAPGQAGVGRLDVYGYGPTHLVVTASDSSTVLDEQVDLTGYQTFAFAIPTAVIGDYLLVAQSTDQAGGQDQLIRAYAVPAAPDLDAPELTLTYPNTYTVLTSSQPTTTINVSGEVFDASAASVIVNGQVFTPTGNLFNAPLELQQGLNIVAVTAVDANSNATFADTVPVYVLPARGVMLSADRATGEVGNAVMFTFVLTASSTLSDVQAIQSLPYALVSDVSVVSPVGEASIIPTDDSADVYWVGDIPGGQPVVVTILGTLAAAGNLTQSTHANWGWGFEDDSNTVLVIITEPPIDENHPPTPANDSAATYEEQAVTITVLANDSDPDDDTLNVENVSTPAYGVVTLNPDDGITYTPNPGFIGLDSFAYIVSDGRGGNAAATVTVTVAHGFLRYCLYANDDDLKLHNDARVNCSVASEEKKVDIQERVVVYGQVDSRGDKVDIAKDSLIYGNVTAADKVDVHDNGRIEGDVVSGDKVDLHNYATVNGDVTASDEVTLHNGATVSGLITEGAPAPAFTGITWLTVNVTPGTQDITVDKNGSLTLPPGVYRDLKVDEGATLTLSSGQYVFRKIDVKKDASVRLDLASGPVLVDVDDHLNMDEGVRMTIVSATGTAADILFRVEGSHAHLKKDGVYLGTFLVPNGHVELHEDSTLTGALYAEKVTVKERTIVTGMPALTLFD